MNAPSPGPPGTYRWSPAASCEPVDDGAMLLHLDTGAYYALNDTGLWLWRAWETPATLAGVAARLAEAFDVTAHEAAADVSGFAAGLLSAGLLEPI